VCVVPRARCPPSSCHLDTVLGDRPWCRDGVAWLWSSHKAGTSTQDHPPVVSGCGRGVMGFAAGKISALGHLPRWLELIPGI